MPPAPSFFWIVYCPMTAAPISGSAAPSARRTPFSGEDESPRTVDARGSTGSAIAPCYLERFTSEAALRVRPPESSENRLSPRRNDQWQEQLYSRAVRAV